MFDYLAIDWGSKRSGLAFGSFETGLILPCQEEVFTTDIWKILEKEIIKRDPKALVVGVPTNFFGKNTEVSNFILEFIQDLKQKYPNLQIDTMEEKGSTKLSKQNSKTAKQVSKHHINHQSAVNILNWYFEKLNYGIR